MTPFLRPARKLAQALAADASPRQLAAGFALGAAAGLIPKTSLLAHGARVRRWRVVRLLLGADVAERLKGLRG